MMVNDAQKIMLREIYSGNGKKLVIGDFSEVLEETEPKIQYYELHSYIRELEDQGIIFVKENAISTGGQLNNQYNSRATMIWFDKIIITRRGQEYVTNEMF